MKEIMKKRMRGTAARPTAAPMTLVSALPNSSSKNKVKKVK